MNNISPELSDHDAGDYFILMLHVEELHNKTLYFRNIKNAYQM